MKFIQLYVYQKIESYSQQISLQKTNPISTKHLKSLKDPKLEKAEKKCLQKQSSISSQRYSCISLLLNFLKMKEKQIKTHTKQPTNLVLEDKYEQWRPEMSNYFVENNNFMRWTPKQNQIYCKFLKENIESFNNQEIRRKRRMYLALSKKLRRRTVFQVKSHHQKMMKKYKTIDNIIANMESIYTHSQEEEQKPHSLACLTQTEIAQKSLIEQVAPQEAKFLTLKQQMDLQQGIEGVVAGIGDTFCFDWFKDE